MSDIGSSLKSSGGTADYRITIRAHNNRILSRVMAKSPSLAHFCRRHKLPYTRIAAIVALKDQAITPQGEWRDCVLQLAAALKVRPDILFTERQVEGLHRSTIIREVSEDRLISIASTEAQALIADDTSPEEHIGRKQAVAAFLLGLTDRERYVVARIHGLDGEPAATFDEVSKEIGVTRERVRQLMLRAFRRGRRPGMAKKLLPYVGGEKYRRLRETEIEADLSERQRALELREQLARTAPERAAAKAALEAEKVDRENRWREELRLGRLARDKAEKAGHLNDDQLVYVHSLRQPLGEIIYFLRNRAGEFLSIALISGTVGIPWTETLFLLRGLLKEGWVQSQDEKLWKLTAGGHDVLEGIP